MNKTQESVRFHESAGVHIEGMKTTPTKENGVRSINGTYLSEPKIKESVKNVKRRLGL